MRHADLRDADCGIAQTLGVVGDWWGWLLLREVAGGVTRFDVLQSVLGISRRALAERLAAMVDDGLLAKRPYSERPPRYDYLLTSRGEGLLPVLVAMQEFGDQWMLGSGEVTATAPVGSGQMERIHALLGTRLPLIRLSAHDGTTVDLLDGTPRVLYCFPGAFVPETHGHPPGWGEIPGAAGCTLESTTYADRHDAFIAAGVQVCGISTQRLDQQAAFADHIRLPFMLLSDANGRLATALRLPMFRVAGQDRLKRVSLLADDHGIIRHVQAPVTDPAGSVNEMLHQARTVAI